MCNEIQACKDNNATEAIISKSSLPSEYRIWIEGEQIILGNIDRYEKNKEKYLFWIDLDAQKYISHRYPAQTLDPMAVRLLKYLVENIGSSIPIINIMKDVYSENTVEADEYDKGKISQHLTQLNNFCTGKNKNKSKDKLGAYLFSEWRQNGLGLNNSFKNK